ncbi:MAG: ABC transporter ATP-binding protein [Anaerolineae bacterium]|jgi:ABC-type multidrug transport system fused ATPase/permease subunit
MRRAARFEGRAQDVGRTLRRLLAYLRPFWPHLAAVSLLVAVSSLSELAGPYLIGVAIDRFISPGSEAPGTSGAPSLLPLVPAEVNQSTGLRATMLILLTTYLLNWGAIAGQFYLMVLVGQRLLYNLRAQIFDRIQSLSLSFFDQHEAGDLMSRLSNDTDVINSVLSAGVVRFASNLLMVMGIAVVMLLLNWRLALAALTTAPAMLAATIFFSRRARTAFRRTRETLGQVSAELEENIAGVRVVQAFGRERASLAEFDAANAANRDANVAAQSITSAFSPTLDVLSSAGLAIVVTYGGYLALNEAGSVGTIVTFLLYVRRFFQPLQGIANLYAQLQAALAGAERIFDLLDAQSEVTDAAPARQLPPVVGRVVFENVHFAYKPSEPVLRGINLVAEPGQTVALVGPTGAGKTTIANLLARFYDVSRGAVLVDGTDVRSVVQASLRGQMGVVLQDTFLFSGTVMENIRYGRLDATDEEVIEAARLAQADDFIRRLPQEYETELGEKGVRLSHGQRQLIAIARAILADPRILILDEATSSVDTRTERMIQSALEELLTDRTAFVIAHRLSTVQHADQVLVIENGQIVEQGTHRELLTRDGKYQNLYVSQFRKTGE